MKTLHNQKIDKLLENPEMKAAGIYAHIRQLVNKNMNENGEGIELVDYINTKYKPLPDVWCYKPPISDNDFHAYEWHEVVHKNDLNNSKIMYLYWLKDIFDGIQLNDNCWLNIVFYKHDLITDSVNEFDPYQLSYIDFYKKRSAA
jgi:hypothetical protein